MDTRNPLMTEKLEKALRLAAIWHRHQNRKASDIPYVEHAFGVAMILDRARFDEDTVIAGLLHDVVEDIEVTEEQVEAAFGVEVAATVKHCTEVKLDAEGRKRPWFDRKRDHLAAAAEATVPARAVMLADKLHNLLSIVVDHNAGRPVWSYFNAGHAEVLWYYRAMIERLGTGDPRLEVLAGRCREALAAVENLGEPDQKNG